MFRKFFFEKIYLPLCGGGIKRDLDMGEYVKRKNSLKLDYGVECFEKDGSYVGRYDSIRDASDATGIAYCQIYACVMGRTRTARGYVWRRVEGDEIEI